MKTFKEYLAESKSNRIYYHVTPSEYVNSILETGLNTNKQGKLFLCSSLESAMVMLIVSNRKPNLSTILEVIVPDNVQVKPDRMWQMHINGTRRSIVSSFALINTEILFDIMKVDKNSLFYIKESINSKNISVVDLSQGQKDLIMKMHRRLVKGAL